MPVRAVRPSRLFNALATQGIAQALGLLTGVLLARSLGPEGRGYLAICVLWPSIAAYVGDLGVAPAITRAVATNRWPVRTASVNALATSFGLAMVWFAPTAAVIIVAFGSTRNQLAAALLYAAIILPLNLSTRFALAIWQGLGDFRRFNSIRLAVFASNAFLVTTLFIASVQDYRGYLAAYVVSNLLVTVLAVRPLARYGLERPRRVVVTWLIRTGLRGHLGNLTPVDSVQVDLAVVSLVFGPALAGTYAVALSGAGLVRATGTAAGTVAIYESAVAPLDVGTSDRGAAFRGTLIVGGVSTVLVVLAAPFIIPPLFGRSFTAAVTPMQILAAGMLLAALRRVLGDMLRGMGKPGVSSTAELGSLMAFGAGLIVFREHGLSGIAAAAVMGYATGTLLAGLGVARSGVSARELFLLRPKDLFQLVPLARSGSGKGR